MGEYKNSQSLAENSQSNHEEKTNMEIDNKTLKDKEKEITFLHDLNRQILNELKDFESENERLKSLVRNLQTTDEDNANMQFESPTESATIVFSVENQTNPLSTGSQTDELLSTPDKQTVKRKLSSDFKKEEENNSKKQKQDEENKCKELINKCK